MVASGRRQSSSTGGGSRPSSDLPAPAPVLGGEEESGHVDAAQRVVVFVAIARHQVHEPPETHLPALIIKYKF